MSQSLYSFFMADGKNLIFFKVNDWIKKNVPVLWQWRQSEKRSIFTIMFIITFSCFTNSTENQWMKLMQYALWEHKIQ